MQLFYSNFLIMRSWSATPCLSTIYSNIVLPSGGTQLQELTEYQHLTFHDPFDTIYTM